MELIVNLIIVFVIIISILKRIQEVAGKGEELKAPRKAPPEALSEQIERVEDFKRSVQDEADSGEDEMPLPPGKVTLEEVFKRFTEQQAPRRPEPVHEPAPFHEPEKSAVPEVPAYTMEPPPVTAAPVPPKRKEPPGKVPIRSPLLNFKGPAVVRGVVMSEILGTPVAMREQSRW